MTARIGRGVAWLAAGCALGAAACGGGPDRPAQPLGTAGLKRSLERLRSAGPVPMRLQATVSEPGADPRTQFTATGTLDLAADAGSATLDVPGLKGLGTPADLRLTWTAATVTVPGARSVPRAQARAGEGQAGLLPDEAGGLAQLTADAQRITERANGVWTFVVPAATAIARGVPAPAGAALTWLGEATATASGRLRQVVLRIPARGPGVGASSALTLDLG